MKAATLPATWAETPSRDTDKDPDPIMSRLTDRRCQSDSEEQPRRNGNTKSSTPDNRNRTWW